MEGITSLSSLYVAYYGCKIIIYLDDPRHVHHTILLHHTSWCHFLSFTVIIVLVLFLNLGEEPPFSWLSGAMAAKECQVSAPPAEKRREQR